MHTIVSEGDTKGPGVALVVIGGVLGFFGASMLAAGAGMGVPGLWVTGALIVLAGIALAVLGSKTLAKVRRMDPGVLEVPATSLYLSSTVPARFRRRIKRGTRDIQSMTARMVLREWVRYTVGTDTRTDSRDVISHPIPIQPTADPEGVAGVLHLEVPSYPPSFESTNNKVRWLVVVDIELADGFTEDSVIPLWVLPATQAGRG